MESSRNINFDVEKNYFRSETNEGVFLGMVKMMAGENLALAEHIKNCEENAKRGHRNNLTFLSKRFVHNALRIIQKYLVGTIVSEINESDGFFGVLMDGSQDVSCKEQMSVVVRYVNQSGNIVERTICFFNASKDTSGKGLYESLQSALLDVGLSLSKAVGCSFDGASNMRSDIIGVQARIQETNPYCIYTWCLSHRFNLVLKSATGSSQEVKTILHFAEETAKLFRSSYTRMNVWTEVAKAVPNFNSQRKLKLIGTTRWSSKQDAISAIMNTETNLYVVIKALIRLCCLPNLDGSSLLLASSALNFWLQYKNIVTNFLLHKIFSLLVPTTKYLQNYGLSILDGIKSLKKSVEQLNASILLLDTYIEQAQLFVEKVNYMLMADVDIISLESETKIIFPTEEEKQEIHNQIKNDFRSFIRCLRHEVDERILKDFNESDSIFQEMQYLDPQYAGENMNLISFKELCKINKITNEGEVRTEMTNFLSDFNNRTPKHGSFLTYEEHDDDEEMCLLIENEEDLIETTARNQNKNVKLVPMQGKLCKCLQCILQYFNEKGMKTMYKNIYKLYKYVATLPSTQVKCERDFSKMKIIKSRLRSSLGEEMLESLIIISTEPDIFRSIDLEDILDEIIASSEKISLYMG